MKIGDCYTCLLANTRKSSTITGRGFRKMGEVSVAENGLAPVYIIGSHTPLSLSLSLSSILLLLPSTLEKDYGEATLSILVVFFTLIFITIVLVPDSSPNQNPIHPAHLDRPREAPGVTHRLGLQHFRGPMSGLVAQAAKLKLLGLGCPPPPFPPPSTTTPSGSVPVARRPASSGRRQVPQAPHRFGDSRSRR